MIKLSVGFSANNTGSARRLAGASNTNPQPLNQEPVDSSDVGGELSFLTAAACTALHIHSSPLIAAAGVPLQICPWPLNITAPDDGQSRLSPLKTIPSCSATSTAVRLVPTAGEPSDTMLSPTSSKFVDLCPSKAERTNQSAAQTSNQTLHLKKSDRNGVPADWLH